jgi:arylsulfatase
MLTGLYPHQVGLARNGRDLTRDGATIAELLRSAGYQTAMAGKWHLSETAPAGGKDDGPEHLAWLNHQADFDRPFANPATYPIHRGFDRHYGTIWGVVDYFDPFSLVEGTRPIRDVPDDFYYTDAITEKSVESIHAMSREDRPFFLYVAHNAPHWPLHARPEDIARYRGQYDRGWHALREGRYRRQVEMGLIDPAKYPRPPLMGNGPDWDALDAGARAQESALMEVHAAMVDRVDQGVGQIVGALRDEGRLDNTIIFVMADNGASPERYLKSGFDRSSETRQGRPIQYRGPLRTRAGDHLGLHRVVLGQRGQHPVPLLEGGGVRGGLSYANDRALARGVPGPARLDHRAGRPRNRPDADLPGSRRGRVPARARRARNQAARRPEPGVDLPGRETRRRSHPLLRTRGGPRGPRRRLEAGGAAGQGEELGAVPRLRGRHRDARPRRPGAASGRGDGEGVVGLGRASRGGDPRGGEEQGHGPGDADRPPGD